MGGLFFCFGLVLKVECFGFEELRVWESSWTLGVPCDSIGRVFAILAVYKSKYFSEVTDLVT